MVSSERSLAIALRWTIPALAAAVVGVAVPAEWARESVFVVQLGLIGLWGLGLGSHLVSRTVEPSGQWFSDIGVRPRRLATIVGLVGLTTFATMLVALASSAALRFHPSTQFLQLLSAADIAWVVVALMAGLALRMRRPFWISAGVLMTAVCIWSIYRYLGEVPFGEAGEWMADAEELGRLIIPFDIAAAVISIGAVVFGVLQPTEQPSDQS